MTHTDFLKACQTAVNDGLMKKAVKSGKPPVMVEDAYVRMHCFFTAEDLFAELDVHAVADLIRQDELKKPSFADALKYADTVYDMYAEAEVKDEKVLTDHIARIKQFWE